MKTVYKRLLTFFIGVPLVLCLSFWPVCNHLPFHLLMLFFITAGTLEFCKIAKNKWEIFPTALILTDVLILWGASTFFCVFHEKYTFINFEYLLWIFTAEIVVFFAIESFVSKTFENSLIKLSISTLILFYCGFLSTFISRIATLNNVSHMLILYFIFVFMCDSSAWFFGVLFGKGTRGFIAASPNKSIVGFIGGIIGSMVCGLIFTLFFPEIFNFPVWKILLTGFLTSIAAIIGDLIESVFKRSCEVKDSGWIIPGRGGALDCLDSLILGAPVFYSCVVFLFK